MYGGFAVAFASALVCELIRALYEYFQGGLSFWLRHVGVWNWALLALTALGVPLMLYRHLHTWDRFAKTVDQLLVATKPHLVIEEI